MTLCPWRCTLCDAYDTHHSDSKSIPSVLAYTTAFMRKHDTLCTCLTAVCACTTQGEVRIAADAAAAARAEGAALRERAESAAASAAAAHTRCEGAEQRAVGLLDEVLRARATVAEHSARVRALEAAAMSCVDKRQVADVLVGLLTRCVSQSVRACPLCMCQHSPSLPVMYVSTVRCCHCMCLLSAAGT